MKAIRELPENYQEIYSVNLQKDKKAATVVNAIAVVIAVVMMVAMHFVVPIVYLFDLKGGMGAYLLRFAVLIVLMVAYMVAHEWIHGVAMKYCGTKKVKYGFTGMYAFAGSDDYYNKKAYLFIALAPIVVWGVVLAIVNLLVPTSWFWIVYMLQICNISGAAGDLYVAVKFSKMPKDILIRDSGVGMTVYSIVRQRRRIEL